MNQRCARVGKSQPEPTNTDFEPTDNDPKCNSYYFETTQTKNLIRTRAYPTRPELIRPDPSAPLIWICSAEKLRSKFLALSLHTYDWEKSTSSACTQKNTLVSNYNFVEVYVNDNFMIDNKNGNLLDMSGISKQH